MGYLPDGSYLLNDGESDWYSPELKRRPFVDIIKESVVPIQYGRGTGQYHLSIAQTNALEKEADGDLHYLMQLYFDAGFYLGRKYEKNRQSSKS